MLRGLAGPLKIAYFGRIDRTKGPDLLVRALKMIPKARVRVDIFAIRQAAGPDQVRLARGTGAAGPTTDAAHGHCAGQGGRRHGRL